MNWFHKRAALWAAAPILLAGISVAAQEALRTPSRIPGFTASATLTQRAREQAFRNALSTDAAREDFTVLTAEPHHVGSPYQIRLAAVVADRFASFGLAVSRDEYSVLVPWPIERMVAIVAPDAVGLEVDEEKLPGDPFAAQSGILPSYNVYTPSGDVTGEVVYVNYGVPSDYELLRRLGISVAGRIVLARYGNSWRGIKPKVAAEHGAIGCLLYSDPRDDGYFQGDAYPNGPFRGSGMIQRGSVLDLPRRPGDPSTPGRPSKPGVERLPLDRLDTLADIPVHPLAASQGLEILKRLDGPVVPEAWRGALPITYRMGPGPVRVRVRLQMDYGQRRLINVVGRISGSRFPDEWIIIGSHRDAWVFGAADPTSGQVAMINVARAMGALLREGWRPQRSVLFVSWDGEEPGLLGSTEWTEEFASELGAKAAVYVNLDPGATGPYFSAAGVHSLAPFLHDVAKSVDADVPGQTLYDRWLERAREFAQVSDPAQMPVPPVGALGSGSDYTPFLDHLGIAAVDLSMNGPGDTGTYHSLYDHPGWFRKYIDPDFRINTRASEVAGVTLLRLADAEILPFDFEAYAQQMLQYLAEVEANARSVWPIDANRLGLAALRAAIQGLAKAGGETLSEREALLAARSSDRAIARLNRRLIAAERDFLEPQGLPDRPWFRHVIYAPGLYTGYAVKTLPGIREAVEARNFPRASEQTQVVLRAIQRATRTLSMR